MLLMLESSGGKNVYGRDPIKCTNPPYTPGGPVTETNYLTYRARRDECGMQGVGPTQLTWYTYQDAADRIGGCWKPDLNCRVGFGILSADLNEHGYRTAFGRYNGGPRWLDDPSAVKYADNAMSLLPAWERVVEGETT